jgi:hypothetical protein
MTPGLLVLLVSKRRLSTELTQNPKVFAIPFPKASCGRCPMGRRASFVRGIWYAAPPIVAGIQIRLRYARGHRDCIFRVAVWTLL